MPALVIDVHVASPRWTNYGEPLFYNGPADRQASIRKKTNLRMVQPSVRTHRTHLKC